MVDRVTRNLRDKEAPRKRGLLFADEAPLLLPLLLVLACVLPFVPGLTGPFLLDDLGNLAPLLGIHADANGFYAAIFNNGSGLLLRPLANLTFAANLLTAGPYPFAFKLTNLALHLGNGMLVFAVAMALLRVLAGNAPSTRRIATALLATALWTIHPLQVSTVLYVVQRMAMLSATFSLVAVGIALWFLAPRTDTARRPHWVVATLLVFLATALAVMGKENGALVPLLLLAVLLSAPPAGRALLAGTPDRLRFWLATVALPLGAGLLVLLAGWHRFIRYGADFTLLQRVLTEPFVLAGYLRSFFFPDLSAMGLFLDDTRLRTASEPMAWLALAVVVSLPMVAIALRRRWPLVAFAILWFLACHAMESTILPLELAFEHRNYLALLGPCLAVAHGVTALAARRRTVAIAFAVALLAFLGVLTYQRARTWSSEASFALTEARHHPDSIRAQNLAAIVEHQQGDLVSPVRRMARMKALYPRAFFPFAMDMDFACDIPGHQVDWPAIRRNAAIRIGSSEVLGYFNHTTIQVARGACPGIATATLDQHLHWLADTAEQRHATRAAQYYTVLRATLRERAAPQAAAQLLYQAAALDPSSSDLWERIATFEITRRQRAPALSALDKARARVPAWSPAAARLAQLRESAKALPQP
jgi:hypothetical protein